jgi:hypothetical protein
LAILVTSLGTRPRVDALIGHPTAFAVVAVLVSALLAAGEPTAARLRRRARDFFAQPVPVLELRAHRPMGTQD